MKILRYIIVFLLFAMSCYATNYWVTATGAGDEDGTELIHAFAGFFDGDDTITVAMTDTTCTGCLTVLMDEIGDTWSLVWTGTTWATTSNSEVP